MADYKAVSQNLMHSDLRITDSIYAPLLGNEIQARIARLSGSGVISTRADYESPSAPRDFSKRQLAEMLRLAANDLEAT